MEINLEQLVSSKLLTKWVSLYGGVFVVVVVFIN